MHDLFLKNARIHDDKDPSDIVVDKGKIVSIRTASKTPAEPEQTEAYRNIYDAAGQWVCSGFYESHIHLDKACILDRCNLEEGTLDEAVEETGKAKSDFTVNDVFDRASRVVEMAIKKGTVGLRTFVETDPKSELRSFEALKKVREKYAFAIDIEICAFAQEGLTDQKETHELLEQALQNGANLTGGCPYKDENPERHIEMIFDLAQKFGVPADFHLDFDLDPENSSIPKISEETVKRHYQGKVSIGHVTKLSAMSPDQRHAMSTLLKNAEVALTVLPATDIFLNGRDYESLIPRGMVNADELTGMGITATLASNNILNAFTPFGDASLLRMANMYANIAQLSKDEAIARVFDMITINAARLLSKRTGIKIGAPANFVVLEAKNAVDAIRTVAQPLAGFKGGRQTFSNAPATIYFEE
ncbi:amidohydrolase family protein [Pricia sp. S334]|uniref:Amidohydrolase family protein n=1 Tax=Pricia mediterranea TaxID=3076079 RepID=A0ABU3L351_9FLAO|nr:amidohydrolase family protein [Pricia sp. S334]MDT7827517.1 amidohydrolase family protein [Pricia sp. S334]